MSGIGSTEIEALKIVKKYDKPVYRAIAYYSVLFTLNDIKLTRKELELLAFIAVRGTITPASARDEFIAQFGSSKASIENIKGSLVRKKMLIRKNRMYRINPTLALDFEKRIVLQINLNNN